MGFLAEFFVLVKSTYFFGTLTSNVGDLVALMRRCEQRRHVSNNYDQRRHHHQQQQPRNDDEEEMKSIVTKYDHFAQSYGVDMDEWDMIEFYINHQ